MDDAGPAHERASVTAARWALGGATVALVALASGATALLVVTSTTGVGLPVEDPHPLPGTTADGFGGSADVLLLPGGSQVMSGTRARRGDTGSDDPLLVLRGAGSGSSSTLPDLAARGSSAGTSAPASESVPPSTGGALEDGDVSPGGDERPQGPARPTPAPGGTTPPAKEPEEREPARGPSRTPAAEPRAEAPAEDDEDADSRKGKAKGNGTGAEKEKEKDKPQDEDAGPDDRDAPERSATTTSSARPPAGAGRPGGH